MSNLYIFFFFKQKTAYEMRISDWSSDVCSSDLLRAYTTQERSGDSYNATALASIMNETWKQSQVWFPQYVGAFLTAVGGGADEQAAHTAARAFADQERLQPGTAEFEKAKEIGSAHVGTQVPNAHLVTRLLHD